MDQGKPSLEISSKLKNLKFEEGGQAENLLELQLKLETAECIFNWVKGVEEPKFLNFIEGNVAVGTTGQSACLQIAATDFEKAFYENFAKMYYLILFGDTDEAKNLLVNWKSKVLDTDRVESAGTTEGYLYLLNTLQAYYLLSKQDSQEESEELNTLSKVTQHFDRLSDESKIVVFRLEYMAYFNFRLQRTDSSVLEMLIKLEPKNARWHLFMYKSYRCSRKVVWSLPGKEEIASICTAMELEPENDYYLINGFQNLSEILKHRSPTSINQDNPIVWRDQNFTTFQQIIIYMKSHTRRMLEKTDFEPGPGFKYCALAGVFSSYLPYYARDLDLAEECIIKAVECNPDCTSINHRRGLIIWQKSRNPVETAFYFRNACDLGNKNWGAMSDLIYLLLANPFEHKDSIATCFTDALAESNVWNDKDKSVFAFLKGCYLLMIGGKRDDIYKCWIDAYTLSSVKNLFSDTVGHSRRFTWKKHLFNLHLCINVVHHPQSGNNLCNANIISIISKHLSEALENAEKGAQRFNNRQRPGIEGNWRSRK